MLSTSVGEVKEAIQTLQDDVQLIKAELLDLKILSGEIKVQLETLTALFQQCQCGAIHCPGSSNVASQTLPAVGNDHLAVVPASGGHQAWNNSAGSGAASSTGWSAGWAGWQNWDSMRGAGLQAWRADSNEDLEEIPFARPNWIKLPCPCLYAGKECDEHTEATYFVYFKSRNHRKNETLCRACTLSHRDELCGIMKMDF